MVEAVVENPKVKQAVLAEVENHVREDAILASNTSTISISLLAKAIDRIDTLFNTDNAITGLSTGYTDLDGMTETILCVANVSRSAQGVELDLSEFAGQVPIEMIGGNAFAPIGQTPFTLTLAPYGFFWFLLASEYQMPGWHTEPSPSVPELVTLVLKDGLEDVLKPPVRTALEQNVLPSWLPTRRWFGHKEAPFEEVEI